jgi:hypothetical protein
MKVKLLGGGSFYGPHGVMLSYAPGTVIDVDLDDETTVSFWRERVIGGAAELVEGKLPSAAKAPVADELDIDDEPDEDTEAAPPRGGPGSDRAAWAAYAESQGVDVDDDMTRDDIVAAVDES